MYKLITGIICCMLLSGCVKKRIYQTEVTNRQVSEAREKVLSAELTDRKAEAEKMIASIGNLNKTIGKQEGDIAELRSRIVQLGTSADKTSTTLLEEKMKLEKQLSEKSNLLIKSNEELSRLQKIITQRNTVLNALQKVVDEAFKGAAEVKTVIAGETIVLTLPDKTLFDQSGVNIPASGKSLIELVAGILAERPALTIDIVSCTDNQLPKGNKILTDTWDWSLRRATALTRLLISDFSINANQLTPVAKGEFYPVSTNETPEGRAQNRRTEIVFKPKLPDTY
jgi:chemotaxis protein MotB